MNELYHLAQRILCTWTYLENDISSFCDDYDITSDEHDYLHADLTDIIEKVFEEKEFKRIMRLIKKDEEELR